MISINSKKNKKTIIKEINRIIILAIFSIIKTEKKKGISNAISRSTNRNRIAIFKNWTHKPEKDLNIELNPHSKGFKLPNSPAWVSLSFFEMPKKGIINKIKVIISLKRNHEETPNEKKINIIHLFFGYFFYENN